MKTKFLFPNPFARRRLLLLALAALAFPAVSAAKVHNVTNLGISGVTDANGGDTTDDTVAIQRAITDAANEGGGTVYIPAGTYYISNWLTTPGGGFKIKGDGNSSILRFTYTPSGGGDPTYKSLFDLDFATVEDHLIITDLKLVSATMNAAAAIDAFVDHGSASPHANSGVLAENLTVERTTGGSWILGLFLHRVYNSKFTNCSFDNGGYTGTAVYVYRPSMNSIFSGCTFTNWHTAFEIPTPPSGDPLPQEGIVIDNCTIGPVTRGVNVSNTGNTAWLSISDSTFEIRNSSSHGIGVAGTLLVSMIRGNTIDLHDSGYHVVTKGEMLSLSGNTFDGKSSGGGVVLAAQTSTVFTSIVRNNTFTNIANGAWLWLQTGNTETSAINNNISLGSGGWYYDQGSSTLNSGNY